MSFRKSLSLQKMGFPNWGMVWCAMVRRGTKPDGVPSQRGIKNAVSNYVMEGHLADGDDVPYFFCALMAMITMWWRMSGKPEKSHP